jgi:hypothetical protein
VLEKKILQYYSLALFRDKCLCVARRPDVLLGETCLCAKGMSNPFMSAGCFECRLLVTLPLYGVVSPRICCVTEVDRQTVLPATSRALCKASARMHPWEQT